MTARDIGEIFRAHSTIQAQALLEPYVNRWIRVEGKLADVGHWNESGGFATARLRPEPRLPSVIMSFRDPAVVRLYLARLEIGTAITVVGRIREMGRYHLFLEDCQVEAPGPVTRPLP